MSLTSSREKTSGRDIFIGESVNKASLGMILKFAKIVLKLANNSPQAAQAASQGWAEGPIGSTGSKYECPRG